MQCVCLGSGSEEFRRSRLQRIFPVAVHFQRLPALEKFQVRVLGSLCQSGCCAENRLQYEGDQLGGHPVNSGETRIRWQCRGQEVCQFRDSFTVRAKGVC